MQVLIDNDDYTFSAEEIDGDVYVHVEVHRWSPETYKRGLLAFEWAKDKFRKAGVTRLRSVSPKGMASKLTNMFGMAPVLETEEHYVNEVVL